MHQSFRDGFEKTSAVDKRLLGAGIGLVGGSAIGAVDAEVNNQKGNNYRNRVLSGALLGAGAGLSSGQILHSAKEIHKHAPKASNYILPTAVGAGVGAGSGALYDNDNRLRGALVGAGMGAGMGALHQKSIHRVHKVHSGIRDAFDKAVEHSWPQRMEPI